MLANKWLILKQLSKCNIDNLVFPDWNFGEKCKIPASNRRKTYEGVNCLGSLV